MDRTTFRDEIIILQKLDKLHIARSTIYLLKLKRVRTRILMRVASYFQQLFIWGGGAARQGRDGRGGQRSREQEELITTRAQIKVNWY